VSAADFQPKPITRWAKLSLTARLVVTIALPLFVGFITHFVVIGAVAAVGSCILGAAMWLTTYAPKYVIYRWASGTVIAFGILDVILGIWIFITASMH
jgi:hypothetical protein